MSAADRAYEHTKARILDGRFAQGELIGEGEVSDAVGVSRTPVREAFLRLEAEGILRLYPKRGALVVPISAADVEDVMETRRLLERFAIARVIELDLVLGDQLAASIASQERRAAAGDPIAFVDADREFHRVFGSERMERIMEQHRGIVGAVERRDPTDAESLIDRHLDETLQRVEDGERGAYRFGHRHQPQPVAKTEVVERA